ncbi:MAG: lipopolysaccharide kinase InaA family protein [Lentisphaeria bacterium]
MLTQVERLYSSGSWRGYIAADWQQEIVDFELWQREHPGETVVSYQSRKVCRVQSAKGTVYVKTILALTDPGMTGKDWLSFLKWVLRPSRALATWRISQRLLAAGFLCARPVLALRKRSHWGYPNDVFISEEVTASVLSEVLPRLNPSQQLELAKLLGLELQKFHAAGFVHGDCILRNLCLSAENKLIYLDNDRSKKRGLWAPFCRSIRNLSQLGYSARRCGAEPDFVVEFIQVYGAKAGWSSRQQENIIARLCGGIEQRLKNRRARK